MLSALIELLDLLRLLGEMLFNWRFSIALMITGVLMYLLLMHLPDSLLRIVLLVVTGIAGGVIGYMWECSANRE